MWKKKFVPLCLDPLDRKPACFPESVLGNGYCNDWVNTAACDFDKGDCCGDNVKTDYCTVCECLETEVCSLAGNGKCDDSANR